MPRFSKPSIFALNLIVLTGALTIALRSKINHGARPDAIVALVFVAVFHLIGWVQLCLEASSHTAAQLAIIGASVLNASVLLQLFVVGGLEGDIWAFLLNGMGLAEASSIAYFLVYGETLQSKAPNGKPVHLELQGVERELERIEKRIVRLRGLVGSSPAKTAEGLQVNASGNDSGKPAFL